MAIVDTFSVPSSGVSTVLNCVQGMDGKIYYSRADAWSTHISSVDVNTHALKEVAMPSYTAANGNTVQFVPHTIKPLGQQLLIGSRGGGVIATVNKTLTRAIYLVSKSADLSWAAQRLHIESPSRVWGGCVLRVGNTNQYGVARVNLNKAELEYWTFPNYFAGIFDISVDTYSKKVWFSIRITHAFDNNAQNWPYSLGYLDLDAANRTTLAVGGIVIGAPNRKQAYTDIHAGGGVVWALNYDQGMGSNGFFCSYDTQNNVATVHANTQAKFFSSMEFNVGASNPTFVTRDGYINEPTGVISGSLPIIHNLEKYVTTGKVALDRIDFSMESVFEETSTYTRTVVQQERLPEFSRWRLPGLVEADPTHIGTFGTDWVYNDARNGVVGLFVK